VVKSAALIAQKTEEDSVEWTHEMQQELGYPEKKVPMHVDSTCTMQCKCKEQALLKEQKHMKVQFFG
jgi:hypothetical protein